jgi:hypothetical protein
MMSEDSNTNTKPKSPPVMGRREGGREGPGEAGNGRQRITDAPLPGLSVRTIGLPLIDAQAKVIIEKSTQARKTF